MKRIVNRNVVLSAFALLAVILTGDSLRTTLAQGSGDRAIDQAQRAVRQQIINQEGGRNLTVLFNTDAQADSSSRSEVRVRGTGSLSRNSRNNDPRYDDSRNNGGSSNDFSYEATVDNRSRNGNVSGIRYELGRGWAGDGRDNNGRANNGRDNSGWDNNGRDNNRGGFGTGNRPNGRASYSGPIINRHSEKALDVNAGSNRDGAGIQLWTYADQPNQNWDVIDLGNGEASIISRQSGKALSGQGGRQNGARITQQTWRGNPQQRWRLDQTGNDSYRIVNVDNGKCLDVNEEGKQDGAIIHLWDCANQASQQWRLRR